MCSQSLNAEPTRHDHRLGFAVKVLGQPLPSHDSRRWQNLPHLSVSLAYLRDIFEFLRRHDIHFYRLAGQLAPYLTHPQLPHFHNQLEECATELANMGDLARQYSLRLSLHPAHYIQLSSPHPEWVDRSLLELESATRLLDAMGLDGEAPLIIHVGGAYGDAAQGRERFVRAMDRASPAIRRRLALEHDDRTYSFSDTYWIHQRTAIRLVFDVLHHRCFDPVGIPIAEALAMALATWPQGERPKIHFSSPRTELRHLVRGGKTVFHLPLPNQHSDFVNPFEFIDFLRAALAAVDRPFDIMLEAKAKDLAVLRLRDQVNRFAPDLAGRLT